MTYGPHVTVIGGGLAGCEAAWQLAERDLSVTLVEMRPAVAGAAHHTADLAELVCSNSLKSDDPSSAAGSLKRELDILGSIVLACARATAVGAGTALAVDRARFAGLVTRVVSEHPGVSVDRREALRLPDGLAVIASGPLTSGPLAEALSEIIGDDRIAFFDAAAPIVDATSIDRGVLFAASRYDKGGGADYLNAPMGPDAYATFVDALLGGERVRAREFESADLFQACQPVEEVARSGRDALRFGALKPVGLTDPATRLRPYAVVQLRPENAAGSAYNLVGFQTNLTFPEQRRVFRLIPGLERAEFVRYGVMHRNTFIDSPRLLRSDLALRAHPRVRVAGQLTGTEGYLEAAAGGLVAALGIAAETRGRSPVVLPRESVLGALLSYATDPDTQRYQPMHVNFGLVPPLEPPVRGRKMRYEAYAARAIATMRAWLASRPDLGTRDAGAAAARAAGAA